jgi:hypothetical protein
MRALPFPDFVQPGMKLTSQQNNNKQGQQMKKLIVMAVAAMVAVSAMAHLFDGYFLAVANGEDKWTGFGPGNQPYELGEVYSLTLGSQIKSWKADGQEINMYYSVYETGGPEGTWANAAMGWCDNYDNDSKSMWATGSNWDSPAQVDIGFAGLAEDKSYTIAVYFQDVSVEGNYGNYGASAEQAGGGNFTATFTKVAAPTSVPEPATMSLLGLGALAMVIRRKLSK